MDTTKSEQIKAGLRENFQAGESARAFTVCYGYKVTFEGRLVAYPIEAVIVFHIFGRSTDGDSLGKIATSLARMEVRSPTGKELWTRETINKILSSEKYAGDVVLGKAQVQNGVQIKVVDHTSQTVMSDHHKAIISRELFGVIQQERAHRNRLKSHSHVV